jgi:hypothetical protein
MYKQSNTALEPTAVGAGRSAVAVSVTETARPDAALAAPPSLTAQSQLETVSS